jgi:hypothetical protein
VPPIPDSYAPPVLGQAMRLRTGKCSTIPADSRPIRFMAKLSPVSNRNPSHFIQWWSHNPAGSYNFVVNGDSWVLIVRVFSGLRASATLPVMTPALGCGKTMGTPCSNTSNRRAFGCNPATSAFQFGRRFRQASRLCPLSALRVQPSPRIFPLVHPDLLRSTLRDL